MNCFEGLAGIATLCFILALGTGVNGQEAKLAEDVVAFKNVAVVSVSPPRVTPAQTVLVSDGKISRIGSVNEVDCDAAKLIVDGTGKFLMPGMMDSHAHLPGPQGLDMKAKDYLLLQLAHGVTSLRVARYEPDYLELRQTAVDEDWIAPRMLLAAPGIHSKSPPIVDPIETFQKYKEQGYDHIKYLSGLTPIEHEAYVRAAHKVGLPIFGHVQRHLDLETVLGYRQDGIEHLHGMTRLQTDGEIDQLKRLIRMAAARRVFHCPTVSWYNGYVLNFERPENELTSRPGLEYMPANIRESWSRWLRTRMAENIEGDKKVREKVLPYFVGSGVPMLISPGDGYFFVPGAAMYEEMKAFSQAGFSNQEILKAATYNGADFYGRTSEFGDLKVGLRSDLVLLGGNPMEDLKHVHSVEGVMLGCRWFGKEELKSALDQLRDTETPK